MKKNGFTLVELLAVIAILGVISVIAIPAVMDMFNNSIDHTMKVQEQGMLDAGNLFVQDSCGRNAINKDRKAICNAGISGKKAYIVSDILTKFGYIDPMYFRESVACMGFVEYDYDSSTGKFSNGKSYVYCGDGTDYHTDQKEASPKHPLNEIKSIYQTYYNKEIIL